MVQSLLALVTLVMTAGLALWRPRLGARSIDHAPAAVLGALACLGLGLVSLDAALGHLRFLVQPVVTIVSLMVVTVICEQVGLFRVLAFRVARAARGDARRLFLYLFLSGSLVGTLFTNDAAVLILTPLVYRLVEDVAEDDWSPANKVPFYFGVLYVANVAGALVISNPINVLVCDLLAISFLEYSAWMFLPAVVSVVVSYLGVRLAFRRHLPRRIRMLPRKPVPRRQARAITTCAVVLGLTLAAFVAGELVGLPIAVVAAGAAATLLLLHPRLVPDGAYRDVARGVSWDVVVFLIGIFLVTQGVVNACVTDGMRDAFTSAVREHRRATMLSTALGSGVVSAFLNNHPTAALVGQLLSELPLEPAQTRFLAFAALIGGDLGPKMLPIGSLAALIWFGLLRLRGVEIRYGLYVAIGVPVTLAAIVLAALTLEAEIALFAGGA